VPRRCEEGLCAQGQPSMQRSETAAEPHRLIASHLLTHCCCVVSLVAGLKCHEAPGARKSGNHQGMWTGEPTSNNRGAHVSATQHIAVVAMAYSAG
jgi:hypothetical protein